ncbi:MAG: HlyC/CorC family transporter [Parachlamydiales bacterium]|nr:HlyC/CorC family transporter [Parachlamydiales bacterium]
MMVPWLSFLGFTLLAVFIQGFFAMFEMACVSFNKMRLHYFASQGKKRAIWLSKLIQRPSRLFGTTLIGITASMQIGSECARRFYESLSIDPDWAPLTQVFLVIIFGELVPMFAARRHPEQLAMTFSPLMILISRILSPIIWAFDMIAMLIHRIMGKSREVPSFLSREEVQKAFEEGEEVREEFNSLVSKVFRVKNLHARQTMTPVHAVKMIASSASIDAARQQLTAHYTPFLPVYHQSVQNIVAIVHLRDLLNVDPKKKVLDVSKPPWFVTQEASLMQILEQFRRNSQSVAVILDAGGHACGLLTIDQIIDTIFGPEQYSPLEIDKGNLYVERTVAGSMTVEQFNRDFQAHLPFKKKETLSDLIVSQLHHPPAKGEAIEIGSFELTVLEPSIRGAKMISVKTIDI